MEDFDKYQALARKTAIYPPSHKVVYPALGLAGEAGEVAEKVKKRIRDHSSSRLGPWLSPSGPTYDPDLIASMTLELGDVLWYVSSIASDLGIKMSDVASANVEKLASRQQRNKLGGSGDNR